MGSSSSYLGILLMARMVFDLDYLVIILFFSTFSESFRMDIWLMSFLISIYSICTLFSPIFGSLSDQYGRRGFLILGLMIFAISSGLMAGAQNWIHSLVARALTGLASAIFFPVLLAELGDRYSFEKRTRAMGLVRLSWPIAFMLGVPLVGYSIEHLNWRLPFVVLTVLALSTGLILNLLGSSEDGSQSQRFPARARLNLFKRVLLDRSSLSGLILMLLAVGSIEGLFTFFPIWMETQFQLGETSISLIFAVMGGGTFLGTLLAAGIGDKIGPKRCAVTGLVISAGCMALLPQLAFSLPATILFVLLLGILFDFSMTVVPVLLTQLASDAKGTILSLNQAMNAGAIALGAALSGLIWVRSGYAMIGLFFGSTAFIGALVGGFNIQVESDSVHEESLDVKGKERL